MGNMESKRRGTNAPLEAGDEPGGSGGSKAAIVAKVLDEIRSAETMSENKQHVQLMGLADPILAPTFAAGLASVLGSVTASQTEASTAHPVAASALRRPVKLEGCRCLSASERAQKFLAPA